jgi:Histidine kinase-like ATPase domain
MPEITWRRAFPGEERQVAVLRQWLGALLPACPERGDVAVVATELGTNAIRHTASRGGQFTVEVTWQKRVVRIVVADGGAPSGPELIDDPLGEHGRGLRVVHGLSARSGVSGDHRGRRVWAEIAWGDAAAAEPASPPASKDTVAAGLAYLASHFAGVPVWFGEATGLWWALANCNQLVPAPTARDLAGLLSQMPATAVPRRLPGAGHGLPGTPGSPSRPHGRAGTAAA